MEGELKEVVRILAANNWPWRLHATYDETISRALDAFERVNQDIPISGMHWFFDHAETISDASIDRIAALDSLVDLQEKPRVRLRDEIHDHRHRRDRCGTDEQRRQLDGTHEARRPWRCT